MTTEKTGATAERFLPESEVRRVVNDGRNFPFATICTQRAVGEAIEQIPRVNVKTIRYGRWLDGHCTACGWEIPAGQREEQTPHITQSKDSSAHFSNSPR